MSSQLRFPRYTTRFSLSAHLYNPTEADKHEIYASVDRLKGLLPSDIDPQDHPTVLYVVGNLFVPGTVNKNGDAVTLEDGLKMYKTFEGQPINIEHNRGNIVGYIVKAGLSEYGTDRLITEEEARNANQPYNVAIVVAVWRVAPDGKKLIQYIQGTNSEDDLSFSFEVGFDDYDIITQPRGTINLALATVVGKHNTPEFAKWDKRLRVNKGSGVTREGDCVARVLVWPIVSLGGGFVAMPAGAVKGVTPITSVESTEETEADEVGEIDAKTGVQYEFSSIQCTLSSQDALPFLNYTAAIPDEDLYTDEDEEGKYGRENEPHVTVRYGLRGSDITPVQLAVQGCGPITAVLGNVSSFENPDKPYDVLKVDVHSEQLNRLHALIGASCDCETTYPVYHSHLTLAYLKKGLASKYIGATVFNGMSLTFASLTFSPVEGNRQELPLGPIQTQSDQVYSSVDPFLDDLMASTPTRQIPLSAGWQTKLAALAGYGQKLPNGVIITLSDGRKLNAEVVSFEMVKVPEDVLLNGVVITDMTPGVPFVNENSSTDLNTYPTRPPEVVAEQRAAEAKREAATNAGYQGKSAEQIASTGTAGEAGLPSTVTASVQSTATTATTTLSADLGKRIQEVVIETIKEQQRHGGLPIKSASAGVSSSTTPSNQANQAPMDLATLKQTVAAAKSVEDLNQVLANVTLFTDIITKASEEQAAARKLAETAAAEAKTSLAQVQAQLDTLTKSHNELIATQQAAAAEAAFQTRMEAVEEVFAFDDAARADIVEEIKACVDDAAFTKWMARAQRMYKGFAKANATPDTTTPAATTTAGDNPFPKKGEKDDDMDDKGCKAAAQTALASAAANVVDPAVSNTIDAAAAAGESLVERLKKVAAKNTRIGGETIETLNARAKATVKSTR